jgi:hypothetical protein
VLVEDLSHVFGGGAVGGAHLGSYAEVDLSLQSSRGLPLLQVSLHGRVAAQASNSSVLPEPPAGA